MFTVLIAVFAFLAGILAGYNAGLRRMWETKRRSFWTGFDCGRRDIKADIPAHIDIHRRMWEIEKG